MNCNNGTMLSPGGRERKQMLTELTQHVQTLHVCVKYDCTNTGGNNAIVAVFVVYITSGSCRVGNELISW